jgi:hypothetical protein
MFFRVVCPLPHIFLSHLSMSLSPWPTQENVNGSLQDSWIYVPRLNRNIWKSSLHVQPKFHPKCSDKMSNFAQVVWSKCLFLTPAWGVYESQGVQLAVSWFLTLLGNNLSFFTISSTPVQVVHGRQFVDESMVFLGDSYRSCQSIGTESA